LEKLIPGVILKEFFKEHKNNFCPADEKSGFSVRHYLIPDFI
jgi:hypothetical protein